MFYDICLNCNNIDWNEVYNVIREAGLSVDSTERVQKAFENSYIKVFIFDNNKLIATGRALSDGVKQAAIYDIAVLPAYQGKGIGKIIINELHKNLQGMNLILYARPGAEGFYERLGYSKMLTGMAKFSNSDSMRERGFI